MTDAAQPIDLRLVEIYDGTGRHLGGVYPPLLADNQLTPAFYQSKLSRPVCQNVSITGGVGDVGLVWMLPLGMTSAAAMPREVLAEMVHEADAGKQIILHGDSDEAVRCVAVLLAAFAGGGHA